LFCIEIPAKPERRKSMDIFHRFPTREKADEFAAAITEQYNRKTFVYYSSQAESDATDVFPFRLDPPIVHVDNFELRDPERDAIRDSVEKFGGEFAGT
jgi:hypothetical protein